MQALTQILVTPISRTQTSLALLLVDETKCISEMSPLNQMKTLSEIDYLITSIPGGHA